MSASTLPTTSQPTVSSAARLDAYLREHRAGLLAFAHRAVGDAAEDLLQECSLRASKGIVAPPPDADINAWMYRIVRNAITDAHRRKSAAVRRGDVLATSVPLQETGAALQDPASQDSEAHACQCYAQVLPTMHPQYAELIETMDLGGATRSEMASALGLSKGAVGVRHHRARKQLRDGLESVCRACSQRGCMSCTCSH